ncbi:MAG TPA: SH3 domain-containing protein [Nitrospira sp.]|nr:SH3 domain-containing protein [Leptospirales bacterium]HNI69577.1 SH3 domain-containing protein [Nitrospira sp.]
MYKSSHSAEKSAHMSFLRIGFFLLLGFASIGCSKTKIVTAASGLYLRSCPQVSCAPLTLVSNGTAVKILEEKESEVIQGATGRWTRVRVDELKLEGWVFGAYLSNAADIPIAGLPPSQLKVEKLDVAFAPIFFNGRDYTVEFCTDDSYTLVKEDAFCEASGKSFEIHEPLYTCGAALSSQACNIAAFAGGIAVRGRGEKQLVGYRRIVADIERSNLQSVLRVANKNGECFRADTADFLKIRDRVLARVQTHDAAVIGADCNDLRNFATDSPFFRVVEFVRR